MCDNVMFTFTPLSPTTSYSHTSPTRVLDKTAMIRSRRGSNVRMGTCRRRVEEERRREGRRVGERKVGGRGEEKLHPIPRLHCVSPMIQKRNEVPRKSP